MTFARIPLKTALKDVVFSAGAGAIVAVFNDIFGALVGMDVHLTQAMTLLGLVIGPILLLPLAVREMQRVSPGADRTQALILLLTRVAVYVVSTLVLTVALG